MKIKPFNVVPELPETIKGIRDIANNVWASWNWEAAQLFIRLDYEMWEKCRQNLVMTLSKLPRELLLDASRDPSFLAALDRVHKNLQYYLDSKTWFQTSHPGSKDMQVAYFSMEFGLDVGLPIYSGGLGILAGDHLKSSSDLGIPLVGVGLLYQQGYFVQQLNSDGWQMELYPVNDWYNMPVTLLKKEGKPVTISVDLIGETLFAHVWQVVIGRTRLILLDTNITENPEHLRPITAQLYGGDRDNRIRQEILLGIGGVRALEALDIHPTVYHMNEGHSAFLALERTRRFMEKYGLGFEEARELVWASTIFTTHTPVPAGNETFTYERISHYFEQYRQSLGLSREQFLELGHEPGVDNVFSMTILALRMAAYCNGVSELHGDVSRKMWQKIWHGLPEQEIPIGHITNGIHTRTWISHDMDELFVRYLGPQFVEEPHNQKLWEKIDRIPDLELWRIHQIRKERLIFFARKRLTQQLARRGAGASELKQAEEVLSSDALTIGFARRFATYKRADLILRDTERLMKYLLDSERPVQFIFAGKAHPHDNGGKEFIRKLVHFSSNPAVRPRFVFLEDYGMNIARYMLQGVDVWLNTPLRPLEASGTSGMKAAANGALNVSTLDGWWAEAYNPQVGWAIGAGEVFADPEEQDRIESEALYNLLERDIIPKFYDQDRTGIPRNWIGMMKASMKQLGALFNTSRMVMDYTSDFYIPAHQSGSRLLDANGDSVRSIARWRKYVAERWEMVHLETDNGTIDREVRSGDDLPVKVRVRLNGLSCEDVAVEVMYGALTADGGIENGRIVRLSCVGNGDGIGFFAGNLPCDVSGRQGYAVRVRTDNPALVHSLTPLFMKWE